MLVYSMKEADARRPELGGPHRGEIQVIFGPMFSGKTTELMRRLKRYQFANHRVLIIKYARDTRYATEAIATHDQQTMSAVSCLALATLADMAKDFGVIGIDEGQFFPDTVAFAEDMSNQGKIVVVAALDGSYQRVGFGDILMLVPLAESVIKLTAVCMQCFADHASFTKRIGTEQQLELIGGADKYLAVCRRCYFEQRPAADGDKQQQSTAAIDEMGETKENRAAISNLL